MDGGADTHPTMYAEPRRLRHLPLKNRRHLIFKMTPPSPTSGFILDNRLSQEYDRQGGRGPTGAIALVPVGRL